MKDIQRFIRENQLSTITDRIAERTTFVEQWHKGSAHWSIRITGGLTRESMTIEFTQGAAYKNRQPKLPTVLDCLAVDAVAIENAGCFEDWADEFGYDTDSRKAEKMYQASVLHARALERVLGTDAYRALLWEVERE